MLHVSRRRTGLSLWELMASVAVLAVLAAVVLPRVAGQRDEAYGNACEVQQGEIELQVQLWHRNTGSYPAANLSDIGADQAYFPDGLPTCPVDGSTYTIDTTGGTVIGHGH